MSEAMPTARTRGGHEGSEGEMSEEQYREIIGRLVAIDRRLDRIEGDVEDVRGDVDAVEDKVDGLDELADYDDEIQEVRDELRYVVQRMDRMELSGRARQAAPLSPTGTMGARGEG